MADEKPPWEIDTEKPPWETETAPWQQEGPSTAMDVAKTTFPSLGRGAVALATTPGTIRDAATSVADWAIGKVSPSTLEHIKAGRKRMEEDPTWAGKIRKYTEVPSYDTAMGKIEGATGPWYNAQTPGGRMWQGALETAPALAVGGGSAIANTVRALGAGIGGEGGRAAGQAVSGALPTSWQPYAAPVGQAIGNVLGASVSPRAAGRAVTWNPMTNEQFNTVNNLRRTDPELVARSTAGQLTNSPFWRNVEANSGRGQAVNARQAEAFTQGAMNRAGVTGAPWDVNDPNNIANTIRTQGNAREGIRNTNEVNPAEFQALNAANRARVPPLAATVANQSDMAPYIQARRDIARGPNWQSPNPPPFPTNIPGPRYDALRSDIQAKGAGTSGPVQQALWGMRGDLDQAFLNSLSPADRAAYARLGTQMQHGYTLQELPYRVDRSTVTPQEVGKAAAGRNDIPMETYGQRAGRVMQEMPERTEKAPAWFNLGLTGAGSVLGYGHGGPMGAVEGGAGTGVLAHLLADAAWRAGATGVGNAVMSRPAQAFLANQMFRPSAATSMTDPSVVAKALAAQPPEVNRQERLKVYRKKPE